VPDEPIVPAAGDPPALTVTVPDLAPVGGTVTVTPTVIPNAQTLPFVTPPAAPAPRAPDGVILTKRELEALTERAVSQALEAHKKANMPEPKIETPPAPPAVDPIIALRAEMAAQKAETDARIAAAEARATEAETKARDAEKKRRAAREKVVEAQLKAIAAKAGIDDEDYALMLYARAASANASAVDEKGEPAPVPPPAPEEFFAGLRKTKPAIFKEQLTVTANTTPAQGAVPAPVAAGAPPPTTVKTVDDMDHREFASTTRDRYGFNPSLVS
jgi:hypothetical protein